MRVRAGSALIWGLLWRTQGGFALSEADLESDSSTQGQHRRLSGDEFCGLAPGGFSCGRGAGPEE